MDPVLLGLAAPSAVNEAGNLLDRTLRSAAKPFAAVLQAVASTLVDSEESSGSLSIGIDDLQTHLEKLQIDLASSIKESLTAAGVDINEAIALRVSETDGRIEVAGDHPQKALIESILAHDEYLSGQLAELLALRQLLVADDNAASESIETVPLGRAEQRGMLAIFSVDEGSARLEFN
jgi:hypothetical protein